MMDPPTSSSLSVSKDGGGMKHPSTPKTANESHPLSSKNISSPTGQLFPQPPILRAAQQQASATITTSCIHNNRSRNAAKIIKGEIHNVLTVM